MNDYYVNPWLLYLIELIHNLDTVTNFCWFLCSTILFVMLYRYFIKSTEFTKTLKSTIALWTTLTVLLIVLPSEKTMYRMLVASYFTKENTQEALETIDMATNKLIDKIIKARNKK